MLCQYEVNYICKTSESYRELAILKGSKEMFCIQFGAKQQMPRKIKDSFHSKQSGNVGTASVVLKPRPDAPANSNYETDKA